MSGYRRAALALHALAPADRRWLLGRLPERHRDRLLPLLDDLKSLGAHFDSADIDALAADDESPAPPFAATGVRAADPAPEPLAAVDAARLSRVLADEPDWIVSLLWRAASPAARERLGQSLGAARVERFVEEATARGAACRSSGSASEPGPAVADALVAAVLQRAGSAASASASADRGAQSWPT